MQSEDRIVIDVVSDVVCPWCYIGQKRVERAISAVPEIAVELRWRPFQLDPTIPPEGRDRRAYMLAKFGSEERLREIHARVAAAGAQEGIAFDFDAIRVSPNTLDAHRVIRWAASAGVQTAVKKRLLSDYFEHGRNVGDHAVLIEAARDCGMDVSLVETLLPTEADVAETRAEIETATRMGISGVPCFLIESRYAVMGAQDAETIADAIRQVSAAKARGELGAA
jgi:predicted DsbA family dithiol-disulfide isomerase